MSGLCAVPSEEGGGALESGHERGIEREVESLGRQDEEDQTHLKHSVHLHRHPHACPNHRIS